MGCKGDGTVKVYDQDGKLIKTIEIEAEVSDGEAYVLPSV
jgi:antitoxin component YwqK of YwqJK toxin-antitoxin module